MTIYPEALASHLDRDATNTCHAWRVTRRDGTVYGFTDHDRPLTVDGTPCEPDAGLAASEARASLGMGVDTMDVEGALSSSALDEDDIAEGLFDGAEVEAFLVNWRQPGNHALLRKATVGKITRRDRRFVAELESLAHTLERPNGRIVSRHCDAELGDGRCGFDLDTTGFHSAGSVEAVETPEILRVSGLEAFAAGWFSGGSLHWAGPLSGRSEHIVDHRRDASGDRIVLRPRTGPAPEEGMAFTIRAGCDKAFSTCKAKFANALNFRGFPHLPGNDAAYRYVVDGGEFDGGPVVP